MKINKVPIQQKGFHLGGVIPAVDSFFEDDYQWPNVLTPVGGGSYSFLEFAIYKCLCVGCKTIWIGTKRKGYRLIREKVGEYAKSDIEIYEPMKDANSRVRVPLFYWHRSNPKNQKYELASVSCKVMERSTRVMGKLSKHIRPNRFFVSFPGCVYDPHSLREFRKQRDSVITPKLLIESGGKTVKDGAMRDFVCQAEDQNVWDDALRDENMGYISQKEAERSGHGFEKIFSKFIDTDDTKRWDVGDLYEVDDWNSYREYMGSDLELEINEDLIDPNNVHRRLSYERRSED